MRLVPGTDTVPNAVNKYLLPHEHQVITVRKHPAILLRPISITLAGLVIAADGSSLYGTTSSGGFPDSTLRGYGTVFKITTNGILSTLFLFNNNLYGARPSSTLVRMTYSKIFYGMTASTIFRLIGTNVTLEWGAIGASPSGPLLQSGEGTFYGTGRLGGAFGKGNIFRLSVSTPLLSTPPVFITPTLNGGNVTLRWSVVADQTFQVQYKTNLTETVWSNLGSAIGTNATSDAVGPGARFYRVVLLP